MKISILVSLFLQLTMISSAFSEVKAFYINDKVEISWNNPLEIEIDYFIIERSKNGQYFKEISKVNVGKNKSSSIQYYEVDYKPFNKRAYYRIKQVGINGKSYYSTVVIAENFKNTKPLHALFSKNQNNSTLKDYEVTNILVVLLDIKRKEYIAKISLLKEGKYLIISSSDVFLPTGDYIVIATSEDVIYGRKITSEGNYSKSAYIQSK